MTDAERKSKTNSLVIIAIEALTRYRTGHDRSDYSAFRDSKRELYDMWGKDRVKPILRFIVVKSGWHSIEA